MEKGFRYKKEKTISGANYLPVNEKEKENSLLPSAAETKGTHFPS